MLKNIQKNEEISLKKIFLNFLQILFAKNKNSCIFAHALNEVRLQQKRISLEDI